MVIIAVDTSTPTLAVAIGDEAGHLLGQWTTLAPRMHATQLHPVIDTLLSSLGYALTDVSGIAVGVGPGSYTGVRLGVTAAKSLAFALGVPVVGVSSLMAAGLALRMTDTPIGVLFDARRGEAYMGLYGPDAGHWRALCEEARLTYQEAAQQMAAVTLQAGGRLWLMGDGAKQGAAALQMIAPTLDVRVHDERSQVLAQHIYQLGIHELITLAMAAKGDAYEHRAHALVPRYLQLAEAEARWREQQSQERR